LTLSLAQLNFTRCAMAVQSLTNHSTEYKGSLESRAGLTVEPCSGSVKRLLSQRRIS